MRKFCRNLTGFTILVLIIAIFSGCFSIINISSSSDLSEVEEFSYIENSGHIWIGRYGGPGGEVTIPSTIDGKTITGISDYAFSGAKTVTSVTIPDTITHIGVQAFEWCSALTHITIPASVTKIGEGSFFGCVELERIDVSWDNEYYSSIDGVLYNKEQYLLITFPAGKSGDFVIPSSVTIIGESAFSHSQALTSVFIPEDIHYIYGNPFIFCVSLTDISVCPDNYFYSNQDGILYSKDRTELISCPAGISGVVDIPEGVITIGDVAFLYCQALTEILIPNSVTNIGSSAFAHCTSLAHIIIPESVTDIGSSAFEYCTSLTHIIIPKSVTSMGYKVFAYCSKLTSVEIKSGLTTIEMWTFISCPALVHIIIPDSVTEIADDVFTGSDKVVIQCSEYSYAHQYAMDYGIDFEFFSSRMND